MPETDAITLRVTAYGEADLIVTFLAARGAKIRGIARAARKSRRRFGAGLDPGGRGLLSYRVQAKSELVTVESVSEPRPAGLGTDPIAGFAAVSVALETADALSVEDEDASRRFRILCELLDAIAAGRDPHVALAWFLAAALADAGFASTFDACVRCGAPLGNQARFDGARAGVVCARCPCDFPVARVDPAMAARVAALTPTSTDDEAARLACEWLGGALGHVLGRPLKSLAFLTAP